MISFLNPSESLICCSEILPSKAHLQDPLCYPNEPGSGEWSVVAPAPGSRGWEGMDHRQRSLSPFSRGVCILLIHRFLWAPARRSWKGKPGFRGRWGLPLETRGWIPWGWAGSGECGSSCWAPAGSRGRSWVEAPGVCVCVRVVCGGGGMWMRSGLSFFLPGLS